MLYYYEHHAKQFDPQVAKYTIKDIQRHLPKITVAAFDLTAQETYIKALQERGQSAATINRRLTSLVAALHFAVDHKMLATVPDIARAKKTYSEGQKPFTFPQIVSLFQAARTENEKRALLLWLTTLPRPAYVLDLTWRQLSDDGTCNYRIPGLRITRKRRACVPFCPTVRAFFEARREADSVYVIKNMRDGKSKLTDFDNTMERLAERAGVTGGAYRIRKFGASYLANGGDEDRAVPDVAIKAFMGHAFTDGPLPVYIVAEMRRALRLFEEILEKIPVEWIPRVERPLSAAKTATDTDQRLSVV